MLIFGASFLLLIVLMAIFGPHLRHNPTDMGASPHLPPSGNFWLGTDEVGRDVFARIAYGARISLQVGLIVQAISLSIGVLVGVLGVYAPKWIAIPLLRLTDGMFAFPDILLAILIIGVFGMGITPVIAALSVTAWPGVARLVRTQVATLKDREFVVASKAIGATPWHVVTRHVLPQLGGILMAVSMVDLAGTILAESTLSFLGIGVQAPTPSWGSMINNARSDMNSHPMLLLWPCIVLSLTIFSLNFVGDSLRAALDPKSGGQVKPFAFLTRLKDRFMGGKRVLETENSESPEEGTTEDAAPEDK